MKTNCFKSLRSDKKQELDVGSALEKGGTWDTGAIPRLSPEGPPWSSRCGGVLLKQKETDSAGWGLGVRDVGYRAVEVNGEILKIRRHMGKNPKLVTPAYLGWLLGGRWQANTAEWRCQHSLVPGGSLSSRVVISVDLIDMSGFLLKPQETQPWDGYPRTEVIP